MLCKDVLEILIHVQNKKKYFFYQKFGLDVPFTPIIYADLFDCIFLEHVSQSLD